MNTLTLSVYIFAVLGSGMMAGLFCSFSYFIMQALSEIPPVKGIAAMQSINRVIVKPAFLFIFFGTGIACVVFLVLGWEQLDNVTLTWASAGGVVYVLGSIVVTIVFNVPLNDRLAVVDAESEAGTKMWQHYLVRWTRWNHVRSIATIASTILLVIAGLNVNG
jgi:uncharacterized membrane protein